MATTLVELKQLLAERFDEVTLLELLNVNSFDLVDIANESSHRANVEAKMALENSQSDGLTFKD